MGKKGDCNMKKTDSRLTINDLYIGMEIKDKNQLSNIYDVWILLVKNKNSEGYTVPEKQNRGKFKICRNIAENWTVFKKSGCLDKRKNSPQSLEWYVIFYGILQQIGVFR